LVDIEVPPLTLGWMNITPALNFPWQPSWI
jgi:hypothetical protein